MTTEMIEAVQRTVEVGLGPERAFEMFTRRMGDWWPLHMHSIAEKRAAGIRFEEGVGGKVVELVDDGTEWEWAEILGWDPPHRFLLSWHPTVDPTVSTELEVRFEATDRGTRVVLEHRGWERLGDKAIAARTDYEEGWAPVLERYRDATIT